MALVYPQEYNSLDPKERQAVRKELELQQESLQALLRSKGWQARTSIFNEILGYYSDHLFSEKQYEEILRAQGACAALAALQNRIVEATEEKIYED